MYKQTTGICSLQMSRQLWRLTCVVFVSAFWNATAVPRLTERRVRVASDSEAALAYWRYYWHMYYIKTTRFLARIVCCLLQVRGLKAGLVLYDLGIAGGLIRDWECIGLLEVQTVQMPSRSSASRRALAVCLLTCAGSLQTKCRLLYCAAQDARRHHDIFRARSPLAFFIMR